MQGDKPEDYYDEPIYKPNTYNDDIELEVGKYLVIRKDGNIHFERYNGTGFAYNDKYITHYYLPMIHQ